MLPVLARTGLHSYHAITDTPDYQGSCKAPNQWVMTKSCSAAFVAMKLRKWLEYNDCTVRWVRREAGHRYPFDSAVLAGFLIDATMISKTPIVFHFYELTKRSEKQQGLTLEQAYEMFLVYALIHQLIALLEPEVHCEIDSNPLRFSQLEKSLESWKEAFSHTIDLLNLATGMLLCVIDGLEYMDYGKAKATSSNILAA
ncbi:uncharacterized protein Bfra_005589 [Botrytis fragariae]|uniref:Uncharacterized protein n=1 Tax=Botrytis fragariae TaxID=1964551 RepID=A0A8H6EHM7_9HELO|nr:uncharacterized protein Bfra_005589 [Botrytis fragariae]KAF5872235.1 hypothetical protein Bfra_005589 [Botrytis fragariae]